MRGGLTWLAVSIALGGCGEPPGKALGDAPGDLARTCEDRAQALIDQCPVGSNPVLGSAAESRCGGQIDVELEDASGAVSGICRGSAGCLVVCNFRDPCPCGVDRVTRDEVICASCEDAASCGNGICEGGESPASCPLDCADACVAGVERCRGETREICEADGDWGEVACRSDQACELIRYGDLTFCQTRVSPSGGTWTDPGRRPYAGDGAPLDIRFRQSIIDCGADCRGLRFVDAGSKALLLRGASLALHDFASGETTGLVFTVPEHFAVNESQLATSAAQPQVIDRARRTTFTADAIVDDTATVTPGAVALSEGGHELAVAMSVYDAPLVALWSTEDGQAHHLLRFVDPAVATNEQATALAFSLGGALLAEGRADGMVVIWNVEEGRYVHLLQTAPKPVLALAWRPTGEPDLLIAGENRVELWDVEAPARRWQIAVNEAAWLAFSPDGEAYAVSPARAVSGTTLGRASDGALVRVIDDDGRLDFSPDGHRLLIDRTVYADRF